MSLKFSSYFRLSNAIEFQNMIILSFRSRYELKVANKRTIKQLRQRKAKRTVIVMEENEMTKENICIVLR